MALIKTTSSPRAGPRYSLRPNRFALTAANIAARACPTRSFPATRRCDLLRLHPPGAFPALRRRFGQFGATVRQRSTGAVAKFRHELFKLLARFGEVAKEVFGVSRLVTPAKLHIVGRGAWVLALEQFHRLALAFDHDPIHQTPAAALLAELRECLAG